MMKQSIFLFSAVSMLCAVHSSTIPDTICVDLAPGAIGGCHNACGGYHRVSDELYVHDNIPSITFAKEPFNDMGSAWALRDADEPNLSGLFSIDVCIDNKDDISSPVECNPTDQDTVYDTVAVTAGSCGFSRSDASTLLSAWSILRAYVANGRWVDGSNPHNWQVADMMYPLLIDDQLAVSAQQWADQCALDYEANIGLGEIIFTQPATTFSHIFLVEASVAWLRQSIGYVYGAMVTAANRDFLTIISDRQRAFGCGVQICAENVFLVCRFTAALPLGETLPYVASATGEAGAGCVASGGSGVNKDGLCIA